MGDTPQHTCALCRKPVDPGYRPFCSKTCADVDLSRWFKGLYRVEGRDGDTKKNS